MIPTYRDANEFIESFPIRFQVSSTAETKNLTSQLKVINYENELKETAHSKDIYQLPTSAQ